MSTQESLQDVLDGPRLLAGEEHLRSEPAEPAPDKASEPSAGAQEVKTGGSDATPAQTKESKSDSKPSEKDVWDDPDGETIPRGVYVATRNKWRQKADEVARELAELRGQLSVYQQQGRKQPDTAQGQGSDPDEPFWTSGPTKFVDSRLSEAERKLTFKVSERLARAQHADYDEVIQVFVAEAANNPALQAQLTASDDPAGFAYQYAKSARQVREAGSVDALLKRREAEIRERLEEEYRKKGAFASAANASTSSAGARGSGATASPVFTGDIPLKDIAPGVGL